VRNQIYHYYCASAIINVDVPRYSRIMAHRNSLRRTLVTVESGLSHTCRQIRLECQPFQHAPQYLEIKSLRRLCLCMCDFRRYLKHFVNVRELEITRGMADWIIEKWYNEPNCNRFYNFPRNSNNGTIFPALEVIVWPFLESEWPANNPREICETVSGAAVRW
jgi:hypothetical protein